MNEIKPENFDHTCYIVGGGTSMKSFDWSLLNGKFVIAINNAYTKLPDAQILYCTDPPWIKDHEKDLVNFTGLIYQGALNLSNPPKMDIVDKQWHLTGPHGLETLPGCLRHGSNSTYAALNMAAVHLGFKKIYLIGIDMKWGIRKNKTTSHWHSETRPHKRVDGEAVYNKMRAAYNTIKQPLLDMGVKVINVNTPEKTDLDVFPIMSVDEVFGLNEPSKEKTIEKGDHVLTLT